MRVGAMLRGIFFRKSPTSIALYDSLHPMMVSSFTFCYWSRFIFSADFQKSEMISLSDSAYRLQKQTSAISMPSAGAVAPTVACRGKRKTLFGWRSLALWKAIPLCAFGDLRRPALLIYFLFFLARHALFRQARLESSHNLGNRHGAGLTRGYDGEQSLPVLLGYERQPWYHLFHSGALEVGRLCRTQGDFLDCCSDGREIDSSSSARRGSGCHVSLSRSRNQNSAVVYPTQETKIISENFISWPDREAILQEQLFPILTS
eukprot:284815485_5